VGQLMADLSGRDNGQRAGPARHRRVWAAADQLMGALEAGSWWGSARSSGSQPNGEAIARQPAESGGFSGLVRCLCLP